MSTPKISFIVPVYNVEKYLSRCLESIAIQTVNDIEIIVVDDGSTDNSVNICDEFYKKHNNVVLIRQKNSGVSVARNKGIENASGTYCAFIDADDYIEPDFAKEMLKAIEGYRADLVCCCIWGGVKADGSFTSIQRMPNDKELNRKEALIEMLAPDAFHGWPWNKFYKTCIIKDNGLIFPVDIRYCEDEVFVVNYIMHREKVIYSSKILYHYVANETSVNHKTYIHRKFDYQYLDRLKADQMNYDTLSTLHDEEVMNALKARLFLSNQIIMNKFLAFYNGDKKTLNIIKKNLKEYYPFYKNNPRYYTGNRKALFHFYLRVEFPSIFRCLHKIKKKIKTVISK